MIHIQRKIEGSLASLEPKIRTIVEQTLSSLPAVHHENFVHTGIDTFNTLKPTERQWKQWSAITTALLPEVRRDDYSFKKNLAAFFQSLNAYFAKPRTDEEVEHHLRISKQYLTQHPNDFFFGKMVVENFGRLAPLDASLNRLRFYKSDRENVWRPGTLIPLGGKLTGNIIRIVSQEAAEAWEKAHQDQYLSEHVEPILVRPKNNRLRAFNIKGGKAIFTRHVGQRISEFVDQKPEFAREVWSQQIEIIKALNRMGINFGDTAHMHNDNFIVELVNGKPVVRVIDFDKASITNRAENPVPELHE